jgi:hypothetical protein
MPDNIETEIRKALDAKAHEVAVPDGLAARTLKLADDGGRSSRAFRDRLRAWRDARGSRARITGYPRVLYAGAAAACAVLLFGLGSLVVGTDALTPGEPPVAMDASGGAEGAGGTTLEAPAPLADEESARRSAGDAAQDKAFSAPSDVDSSGSTAIAPVPPVPATGKFPPKIVKTANVEVEVKRFDAAWSRANAIATRFGGFVTNSSTEAVKDRLGRGSLVMRVPAEKLDAAIVELRKLGSLANMSTSADDISAPIADVKARLKALETQELQLLELMGRANTLSETLEVRSQLDSVRQEIESYKAQRDVYENQVQYSTINATIFERGVDPSDPDDGDGILRDALETALRVGLTVVAGALVVLGGLVPLAAIGLLVWFIVRAARRRRTA